MHYKWSAENKLFTGKIAEWTITSMKSLVYSALSPQWKVDFLHFIYDLKKSQTQIYIKYSPPKASYNLQWKLSRPKYDIPCLGNLFERNCVYCGLVRTNMLYTF